MNDDWRSVDLDEDPFGAIGVFLKALESDETNRTLRALLTLAYARTGNLEDCVLQARIVLKLRPEGQLISHCLVDSLLQLGRHSEAAYEAKRFLAMYKDNPDAIAARPEKERQRIPDYLELLEEILQGISTERILRMRKIIGPMTGE